MPSAPPSSGSIPMWSRASGNGMSSGCSAMRPSFATAARSRRRSRTRARRCRCATRPRCMSSSGRTRRNRTRHPAATATGRPPRPSRRRSRSASRRRASASSVRPPCTPQCRHAASSTTISQTAGCVTSSRQSVPPLRLSRAEILAYRRRVGALDERLPWARDALRRSAHAGLVDSMPRAALLSIHARVDSVGPSAWEDPAFAQVWGPRYSVYVVPAEDIAVFTLARLPGHGKRQVAEELTACLDELLAGSRMRYDDAGHALGTHGNNLRYAAMTGRLAIRWEGAWRPLVWVVPPPAIDEREAGRELARRYLRVFGPAKPEGFAKWASIGARRAVAIFESLEPELLSARTPLGEGWLLAADEAVMRAPAPPAAAARPL